jgi:hypothetical protein
MQRVSAFLIALGLAAAAHAQADRRGDPGQGRGDRADGFAYVGAGGSLAVERLYLPPGVDADDTGAIDLLAGYRLNEYVALEAEAQILAEFDTDPSGAGGDIDGVAWTASAKLFPLQDPQARASFDPFLLLGAGLLDLDGPHRIEANDTNWMYVIGAGLDLPLDEQFVAELKGTYRYPQGALSGFDYWTVGVNLQYRF